MSDPLYYNGRPLKTKLNPIIARPNAIVAGQIVPEWLGATYIRPSLKPGQNPGYTEMNIAR